MKSQQKKKRIAAEVKRSSDAQEARNASPSLQKMYDAFIPRASGARMPKFSADPWGNRIPTEDARLLWVLKLTKMRNEDVNA